MARFPQFVDLRTRVTIHKGVGIRKSSIKHLYFCFPKEEGNNFHRSGTALCLNVLVPPCLGEAKGVPAIYPRCLYPGHLFLSNHELTASDDMAVGNN
jgi:hypothetical protein